MKTKKLTKDFTKFFVIGLIWALISIFLMWSLIDLLGFYGWLGSSIIVVFVFFGKFYTYLLTDLFYNNFLKYASANISFSIVTVALMSLATDILAVPAKISSPIVIGGLFILRFLIYKKIKLIKN